MLLGIFLSKWKILNISDLTLKELDNAPQNVIYLFQSIPKEFVEYMNALGMNPWNWGNWGDPFKDDVAADKFRSLWIKTKEYFSLD